MSETLNNQNGIVGNAVVVMNVTKRDGRQVSFNESLISQAIEKAFCADLNLKSVTDLSEAQRTRIHDITRNVVETAKPLSLAKDGISVEKIQDVVEAELMKNQYFSVARRYILYRAEHNKIRQLRAEERMENPQAFPSMMVNRDGQLENLDFQRLREQISTACEGLEETCSAEELFVEVQKQFFNGITPREIARCMVLAARARIENDPDYDTVASRLVLNIIYRESLGKSSATRDVIERYRNQFDDYIAEGIEAERLSPELSNFDLDRLASIIVPERDALFPYLGLQTIYDRYLLHIEGRRFESPQYFWMRVAMGLSINEADRNERAIEFYNILSTFRFTSATPTLFNAGTLHPQLSSCYLSTVSDDLDSIFKQIGDNARLSKWAGGLGNDWTNIRATNSHIKGTNGQSQGVIPFLKVVSDTAVAVNQGGKRKGAVCSYLETWHLDIEEFLDLRKNTGDDRRRTHDMHTANWIPDLFMRRVHEEGQWTLFSPDEVPDLHDLYGKAFEERYTYYEQQAAEGKLRLSRTIPAQDLWRKMLTRVFETGHPWITFKDPSNVRSPQDHCGVVHSSNLCTEILLNTSADETAVCNLGSINMLNHITEGELDLEKLEETINTAVRMLDNVIDINFYPTEEAKNANHRHRPVGLGLMGFQDALSACGISYASDEGVEFADRSMEAISWFALMASSRLAGERGTYSSYEGSKWDRGLLPIDTVATLEEERGMAIDMDKSTTMDWSVVRKQIKKHGMRNSNVMAIAPTATISTIIGVTQSIEPTYKHLFVKSNLSGEFVQLNVKLVNELKERDLWCDELLEAIKYYDGSLGDIPGLPEDIKGRFATAFEIEPQWLIKAASRRQKWIDMGQSLNLYLGQPSGRRLDEMYKYAWVAGLKTTYYLRSLGATQVEKSTVDINKFGVQPRWMKNSSSSSDIAVERQPEVQACSIDDPDCEACQ
ncbi:ribonucleoside-diphosphate reductase subunit alpha [Mariniblastus fucicola]|uniref:Ribonucleoside-diphosphate reductase n=1 Tax=Mariniblastus fucicola TaxID=980251 RepID=A0A5B9PP11_9BACT|nr:ribonucleoside-diphosphate reductase subunit alpha [Mariniblastus fucicola]QEG23993.1 Ribonucleoside-diphosphate reductase 1 subunit alpha [Mariniblastus fucicola]